MRGQTNARLTGTGALQRKTYALEQRLRPWQSRRCANVTVMVAPLDDDELVSSVELVAPRTRFRRLAKVAACQTPPIMPPA